MTWQLRWLLGWNELDATFRRGIIELSRMMPKVIDLLAKPSPSRLHLGFNNNLLVNEQHHFTLFYSCFAFLTFFHLGSDSRFSSLINLGHHSLMTQNILLMWLDCSWKKVDCWYSWMLRDTVRKILWPDWDSNPLHLPTLAVWSHWFSLTYSHFSTSSGSIWRLIGSHHSQGGHINCLGTIITALRVNLKNCEEYWNIVWKWRPV